MYFKELLPALPYSLKKPNGHFLRTFFTRRVYFCPKFSTEGHVEFPLSETAKVAQAVYSWLQIMP